MEMDKDVIYEKGIEAIVIAAQDQALRTNWIKLAIDK